MSHLGFKPVFESDHFHSFSSHSCCTSSSHVLFFSSFRPPSPPSLHTNRCHDTDQDRIHRAIPTESSKICHLFPNMNNLLVIQGPAVAEVQILVIHRTCGVLIEHFWALGVVRSKVSSEVFRVPTLPLNGFTDLRRLCGCSTRAQLIEFGNSRRI
jgi:hypothetical protein